MTTPCLFLILSCVFQRVLELEVAAVEHQFIFIDEAGFNLTKRRKRGRNIIGQRAIVEVPGQRGGNITMCAAITHHGVIHHHATLGPYNTAHLITFLDTLHNTLIPPDQVDGPEQLRYVVILGQRKFPQGCSDSQLVHCPPMLFSCLSPSIVSIPQSYWGIFFCLEMESVWPKSTNAYTSSPSYGGRMWRYSSWCFSWLESPC